jgi:AraC-like DNA-binding protein
MDPRFDRPTRLGDLLPGVVASAVGYDSGPDGSPAIAGTAVHQPGVRPLHRGLPSPYLTFIVSLNGPVVGGYTPQRARAEPLRADVLVAGLHDHASYVVRPDRDVGIQLAVYPVAVRALLGMPLGRLPENNWNAADLLGRDGSRLWERLAETSDWATRYAIARQFLQQRVEQNERSAAIRPELAEACRWLAEQRGLASIADLARHVHLSRRQLQSLFGAEFGVSPKLYNRLIRYHRAIWMISSGIRGSSGVGARRDDHGGPDDSDADDPDGVRDHGCDSGGHHRDDHDKSPVVLPRRRTGLADIAAVCGYADQSHLNRDFAAFTGTSPTGWIAEEFGAIVAGGHRNGDSEL